MHLLYPRGRAAMYQEKYKIAPHLTVHALSTADIPVARSMRRWRTVALHLIIAQASLVPAAEACYSSE